MKWCARAIVRVITIRRLAFRISSNGRTLKQCLEFTPRYTKYVERILWIVKRCKDGIGDSVTVVWALIKTILGSGRPSTVTQDNTKAAIIASLLDLTAVVQRGNTTKQSLPKKKKKQSPEIRKKPPGMSRHGVSIHYYTIMRAGRRSLRKNMKGNASNTRRIG